MRFLQENTLHAIEEKIERIVEFALFFIRFGMLQMICNMFYQPRAITGFEEWLKVRQHVVLLFPGGGEI